MANENNPSGYLVFQGFITEMELLFDPKTNHVRLRLLPIESILANAYYKNGASFTVSFSAKDCDFMLGAVIDDVNSVQGATYFTKNLAAPGESITVDLKYNKHLDAANKIISFLDQTWYLRTRPNGQIDLQQYPGTATHKLTIGLHVQALDITLSILDLKNLCVVTWGSGPTDSNYKDATSQGLYGHREEQINDSNIKDSGSSDAAGNGDVARKKNPVVKGIITVNTNYAIESILPGDTCQIFNNTTGGAAILAGIMNIVRVEYDGNTAVLHLADYVEVFGTEFTRALGKMTQI